MPVPLTAVRLGGRPDLPLLVLGPAEGHAATDLWGAVARHLAADFQVVAWDLPGHGTNRTAHAEPRGATDLVEELAAGVLELVDAMARGIHPPVFAHVGVAVGGDVGLALRLRGPERVPAALVLDVADLADPEVAARRVREQLLGPADAPRPAAEERAAAAADLVAAVSAAVAAARERGLDAAAVEEAVRRALLRDSAP